MAFNTILSLSFLRFLLLCFHYLWNGWGQKRKWWLKNIRCGGGGGGGVAKNILHNVGKIVL